MVTMKIIERPRSQAAKRGRRGWGTQQWQCAHSWRSCREEGIFSPAGEGRLRGGEGRGGGGGGGGGKESITSRKFYAQRGGHRREGGDQRHGNQRARSVAVVSAQERVAHVGEVAAVGAVRHRSAAMRLAHHPAAVDAELLHAALLVLKRDVPAQDVTKAVRRTGGTPRT